MKAIRPDTIKRVLIRGTNWVGDAVMSIPAMREIRRVFSSARITLLARPWVRDVYSNVDFIDEIIEYDKAGRHGGARGLFRLITELRPGNFEVAVLLQNAMEAAVIAWIARIPYRVGYARDGRRLLLTHPIEIDNNVRRVHQAHYYLGMLYGAGLLDFKSWERKDYPLSIRIGVTEKQRQSTLDLLRSKGIFGKEVLIGINPGAAYGGAKRWLHDRYAAVADALAEEFHADIVLFGSLDERPLAKAIAGMMYHPSTILSGQTTLGQLMGLLRECRLLITNDSGPMHLAAALDVPQIAIFGSTSEVATGPLSSRAVVVKHPVNCNPCFLRDCPIDLRCMYGVTADMVLGAAREILRQRGSRFGD